MPSETTPEQREVLDRLGQIRDAQARLVERGAELQAERLALFLKGRDMVPRLTHRAMGDAAGVTDHAVEGAIYAAAKRKARTA